MWDGHLGTMGKVQHRIEAREGEKPFPSVPFKAGIRMYEIEEAEIQKIFDEGVAILVPSTD